MQLPQLAQAAVDVLQMAGLHAGHIGRKVAGQCLVKEVQRGFKIIAVRLLDMVVEAVDVFKMTDGFPIKAPQRAGIAQSFKSPGIERAVDPGPYGGAFRAFQLFQSFVQDTQSLRRGVGGGGQLFLDVLEGGPCLGGVGKETAQLAQGFFLFGPGVQKSLEIPCLLDLAGFTHHLLVLLDAFLHGLVDLVPLLAFLQFEIVRGIHCKGQFFGSLGQQGKRRFHHGGRIAEQRACGCGGCRRIAGRGLHLGVLNGKIDAHDELRLPIP